MNRTSPWSFHNPVRILGRSPYLEALPRCLPETGKVLLVTSRGFTQRGVSAQVCAALNREVIVYDEVQPNPELDALDEATTQLSQQDIAAVVALGGGSALDSGKVLSATLKAPEKTLHSIFREQKHPQKWQARLPIVAIPTTSGTGAEVTPFATVWDSKTHSKHSVSGPLMFVDHAILDPTLTHGLPRSVTLHSGLDAISHALESLWNRKSSPTSQPWALQALTLALEALPLVLDTPDHAEARAKMQEASVLSGLAISQTQTAIAHSISYPVTSVYGVAHGLACSFTLPALIDFYLPSLPAGAIRDAMLKAAETLRGLNLADEMRAHVTLDDLTSQIDRMFHPERAANFALPIQRSDVIEILNRSL
jgi:phosphonate metabolism-associated iron-containing alcohol dehydrogenase